MAIKIKNLNFTYDEEEVLNNLSLTIDEGKFYSIIGPNGSGKSTLIKNILSILKPESGEIEVEGKSIKDFAAMELSRLLSYVPQSTSTDFEFTVKELVSMGRYPYLKRFEDLKKEDYIIIEKALEITGLTEFSEKKISEISGGELQRASVARCLAQDTPYIFLDEPVNHLDVSHQVQILRELRKMTPEKTIISVMHDLNLASVYSDEIVLLNHGEIVKSGKNGEVLNNEILSSVYNMNFKILNDASGKSYIFPETTI